MPYVTELAKTSGEPDKIEQYHRYVLQLARCCDALPIQPKISILLPVYKVDPDFFTKTLQSVELQSYKNWELCIVDDASGQKNLEEIISEFSLRHPGQVKFKKHETNKHISITSNSCLDLATGEYLALLDHDDLLLPNALGEAVRYINMNQEPDILYSDERLINEKGRRINIPFHKPDWSPYMHLVKNYTTHLSVYRASLVRDVGGFRAGFEGSQDHDLMLRLTEATKKTVVHIPMILYQWRAHQASTAAGASAKPYAAVAGEKAVGEACVRRGKPAKVSFEITTGQYRLEFDLPSVLPLVSIIIPSKNSFEIVKACIDSIFAKTTYSNFEIVLVDNGSTDSSCMRFYEELTAQRGARFRVIRHDIPFNFGKLNDFGAKAAKGEYFLFLNNDTEVISPRWIEEMLSLAQHRDVGAVGCKLLYPDGTIQHAGVALNPDSVANHIGLQLQADDNVYSSALQTIHEVSAVSAACLISRKDVFELVGGFDDLFLPNGYGDIDYCLKLRAKNLLCLYTPYAVLTHYESKTRKKNVEVFERIFMQTKWGSILINDPYLSPHIEAGGAYRLKKSYFEMDIHWDEYARRFLKNTELSKSTSKDS